MIDLAVGAGQQAAYGAALVLAASGAEDPDNTQTIHQIFYLHPLMLKYGCSRRPMALT